MIPEDLAKLKRELDLFFLLDPILVLEFTSLRAHATVEAALKIIDLSNLTIFLSLDLPEYVLHADKVNSVDLLFVLINFEFIESEYSYNQSVRMLSHMPIVVLDNFGEEDELMLGKRFQKDFVV